MISSQTDPFEVGKGLQSARQNLRTKWEELKAPSEKSAHRKRRQTKKCSGGGGVGAANLGLFGACVHMDTCVRCVHSSVYEHTHVRHHVYMQTPKQHDRVTYAHVYETSDTFLLDRTRDTRRRDQWDRMPTGKAPPRRGERRVSLTQASAAPDTDIGNIITEAESAQGSGEPVTKDPARAADLALTASGKEPFLLPRSFASPPP